MKVSFLLIVSLFVFLSSKAGAQQGYPPPCTEVEQVNLLTDSVKRRILYEFIQSCLNENGFSVRYNKGIVYLTQYTNEEGKPCWDLYARIDDSYKDNPPSQFMDFQGDIVLVYQGDEKRRPLKAAKDKEVLNKCLEKIIGDRVFTRPTTKERWTSDVMPISNRPRKIGNSRDMTGGAGQIAIIFNSDGTYEKRQYY